MTQILKSNYVQLADHESRIAQNESDISDNASDISTNASAISTNASNISTNASNISTNASNISDNDNDIAGHESRITALEGLGTIGLKVVSIGDWDMDNAATVTVAHGLTFATIVSVTCMIRNDDNTTKYQLSNEYNTSVDGGVVSVDSTNVTLGRAALGAYDSGDFDSTSYNRGWVLISYT